MTIALKHKSFLADSSNKFFKVGLGISISLSIVAFQLSFARNKLTPIFKPEAQDAGFIITYVRPVAEEVKKEEVPVFEKKIVNPVIVSTTSTAVEPPPAVNVFPTPPSGSSTVNVIPPAPPPVKKIEVYNFVELMPSFKGGEKAMFSYIIKNINYNATAAEYGIEGVVYVRFIINKAGEVTQAEVVKGVHPLLDNEALRIIKNMPNWSAGVQNGEKVNVVMVLPINFTLE